MRFTVASVATLALPAVLAAQAQQGTALSPNQQLAHDIYKQLVEINTVDSVGSTTVAADAMAKRFLDAWCKAGPAHHCAIGLGHIAPKIQKLGALLGIETVII